MPASAANIRLDPLPASELAVSSFQPENYGSVLEKCLQRDRARPLGAGAAEKESRELLENLSVQSAFAHTTPVDERMARCCLAAVWLLHDCLDESHTISQGISSPEGSFWHGIMHRREGDFSNAKYWFRKVGEHPVFESLAAQAKQLGCQSAAGRYDPFAFVDACQAAVSGASSHADLCVQLQQREWELLFDHCFRAAVSE